MYIYIYELASSDDEVKEHKMATLFPRAPKFPEAVNDVTRTRL